MIHASTLPHRLAIATRQSRLALWQAEHVQARLAALYPASGVSLLPMTTRGDEILDRSLAKIGGKGLFVKELEVAMAEGRADLAVHSAKDVPMTLPEGFVIAAILSREDPRDAFVSNRFDDLASMPAGCVVGTSSVRREAQIRERFPHLRCVPLRGNVDTRLAKLDAGECDAAILATAGLQRLGLGHRIRARLSIADSLPAPGQGALAIEVATADPRIAPWIAALDDAPTAQCVRAERAVSRALGGSCQVPLGAHATLDGTRLHLRGLLAAPDGSRVVRAEVQADLGDASPESIGERVADALRREGGAALLAAIGAGE